MKSYSISDAAEALKIDRTTLRRWVGKKLIPAPTPGIVGGRLCKCWTEDDLAAIREHKKSGFWGKGIDRRTGKKAKHTKQ
jgi:DNA-binding transcriptional MerR regulator